VFVPNPKGSYKGFGGLLENLHDVESSLFIPSDVIKYLLATDMLQIKTLRLNGEILGLTSGEELPNVEGG
tara:strand:+ start:213 stop:422 length:210 start_codon:yes stop_codon:yes gene_type:complete